VSFANSCSPDSSRSLSSAVLIDRKAFAKFHQESRPKICREL
jgi:hypothetical protein